MTMILTILAVAARIFSNTYSNVMQKQLTSGGEAATKVNFFSYLIPALALLPCLPFLGLAALGKEFWIPMLICGMLAAAGNACLIKALNIGELSVLGPLNSYKVIVSMIVAYFLIGEIPGLYGFLGVALILGGSLFVAGRTPENRLRWRILLRPDIQFRFYAILCTATEAVFLKQTILASNPFTSFVLWCILSALFSGMLHGIFRRGNRTPLFSLSRKTFGMLLLLASTTGIMQFTTNYVFQRMQVSYALALFQLSSLLSVILGGILFQERDMRRKLAGSLLMILGAVLILLKIHS